MSQIASRVTNQTDGRRQTPPPVPSEPKPKLQEMFAPIAPALAHMEKTLQSNLCSDTPWVDQLLEHSRLLSGKRMRPVLLLLAGLAVKQRSNPKFQVEDLPSELIPMAAAVEMIHTATLVHDDVIDDANMRRHKPTANSRWDNRISVLLGDYLFTHAFHVGSQSGSVKALAMLASASNKVCAGEMKQNFYSGRFDISTDLYYEIISEKTAELCAVACAAGALLADADQTLLDGFEQYGLDLGMAFQIIDDILDLVGDADTVGKTLGTDLANRKPTLPMIHCLECLPVDRRQHLLRLIPDAQELPQVIDILTETGSINFARDVAQSHINNAVSFANDLGEGSAANSLLMIANFVLKRSK